MQANDNVVAVVNLGEVIERRRLLGKRQHILAPVVLDFDVAFLDVDIRGAVLAHGSEFDQMAVGPQLADREEQIQSADDVVDLSGNRMLAVDHRIRRGPLLGEMDHCVGLTGFDRGSEEVVIGHVADQQLDILAGEIAPGLETFGKRPDWCQGLNAEFMVPLPPHEVVYSGYFMPFGRQV